MMIALFQISVPCVPWPGLLCCSRAPFIDPGLAGRLAGGSEAAQCPPGRRSVIITPSVISDTTTERQDPFILFNPKVPYIK